MSPIEVGLSGSSSATAANSSPISVNNETPASSAVMWIALAAVGVVGLVLWFKLRG